MDPHDPVARLLYRLMKDNLPVGIVEAQIEHCRAVTKEIPDTGLGQIACEFAEKIAALSG